VCIFAPSLVRIIERLQAAAASAVAAGALDALLTGCADAVHELAGADAAAADGGGGAASVTVPAALGKLFVASVKPFRAPLALRRIARSFSEAL
jgi:hypothetical protein